MTTTSLGWRPRWNRWGLWLGTVSTMAGSIVGWLLLAGSDASAATYGAHDINSGQMLTWVLFDQPQGEIWGYACDVPSYFVSNAAGVIPLSSHHISATALDGSTLSGDGFNITRYAIVWDESWSRFRTVRLHQARFAVWNEYRGQSNYYWRIISSYAGNEIVATAVESSGAGINSQTGWFDNNMTISSLGRACVNGGISAATEVVERELGVRFVQHEAQPR